MKTSKLLTVFIVFFYSFILVSCDDDDNRIIPDYASEVIGSYTQSSNSSIIVITRTANDQITLSNGPNSTFLSSDINVTISDKRSVPLFQAFTYTVFTDDAAVTLSESGGSYTLTVTIDSDRFVGSKQ